MERGAHTPLKFLKNTPSTITKTHIITMIVEDLELLHHIVPGDAVPGLPPEDDRTADPEAAVIPEDGRVPEADPDLEGTLGIGIVEVDRDLGVTVENHDQDQKNVAGQDPEKNLSLKGDQRLITAVQKAKREIVSPGVGVKQNTLGANLVIENQRNTRQEGSIKTKVGVDLDPELEKSL